MNKNYYRAKQLMAGWVILWLSLLTPVSAWAQSYDAAGNLTGAQVCTGAGCGQGAGQGTNQGGVSAKDLGGVVDESGDVVLPDGVEDTRQGAVQGAAQGSGVDIEATNSKTGANSDNNIGVNTDSKVTNSVDNVVNDVTDVNAIGTTGKNVSSSNTGDGGIKTGNAGIGVTQVKNDNTTVIGGQAGLEVSGYEGNYNGDYEIGFGSGGAVLSGADGNKSVQAINETTGAESGNNIDVVTQLKEINEVENDGIIENVLNLVAETGGNDASKNTGDAEITTGNASIAATLVNLLNTTVINGNLWIAVADIFGDLNGNILLSDLAMWASVLGGSNDVEIDAINENTGSESDNKIDIDILDEELTEVKNDAVIDTKVTADAITGQNEANKNTGGAEVSSGDASVQASNVSVANTTVEGGNWGLIIVSALNQWLGFLVSDSGDVQALSQEETLKQIEAQNSNTGSDSENTIAIKDENKKATKVDNDAVIVNDINASAITGQNTANKNTGGAKINTGKANVEATAVNIANTTVKDGSLFIAVVNVLGNWFGDLIYGGNSLASAANGGTVTVDAENQQTGEGSANEIDVNVESHKETKIDNQADISTILDANVDTGNNKANKNTDGAVIDTGDGWLALHSRAAANLSAIAENGGRSLVVNGLNDTTGFDSENKIKARLNDERLVEINNDANVSTIFSGGANTGNNEASKNTIGGVISTGNIGGDIGIDNLVNKVLLALGGGNVVVDAELMNILTGALSENSNEVEFDPNVIAEIINNGLIDNLIDLLFNTGGNKSNENTLVSAGDGPAFAAASAGKGGISTGSVCVAGGINNEVNSYGLLGTIGASLGINSFGSVSNIAGITTTTGNNEMKSNTVGSSGVNSRDCNDTLAVVVPGEEDEEILDDDDNGDDDGNGGEDGDSSSGDDGEVNGATSGGGDDRQGSVGKGNGGSILKRFPVAGAQAQAVMYGATAKWNHWLVVAGFLVVLIAWRRDRMFARARG